MTALNKRISNEIDLKLKALALEVYQLQMDKMPELKNNQSEVHFQKSVRDTEYTLLYFSNALSVSSPLLFLNYIKWFSSIMINMSMSLKYLKMSVLCIEEVLSRYFDAEAYEMIHEYIEEAVLNFDRDKNEAKIEPTITPLTKYRNQYIENILNGKRDLANQMILELVESKHSIEDIYLEIFHESLHEIGRLWQSNKISIAEEHYFTASTQLIMSQLYPYIFSTPKNNLVFVGASVGGELHEFGIRMVSDFMELNGWNTYYLGASTPLKNIIETIKKEKAHVIGISVTMTYHLDETVKIIEAIRKDEHCKPIKILVGGYPFHIDNILWKKIGADGFSKNARDAVSIANQLIAEVDVHGKR